MVLLLPLIAPIRQVLRVADEFDIDVVLEGAAEAYLVLDEIEAAGCR